MSLTVTVQICLLTGTFKLSIKFFPGYHLRMFWMFLKEWFNRMIWIILKECFGWILWMIWKLNDYKEWYDEWFEKNVLMNISFEWF